MKLNKYQVLKAIGFNIAYYYYHHQYWLQGVTIKSPSTAANLTYYTHLEFFTPLTVLPYRSIRLRPSRRYI